MRPKVKDIAEVGQFAVAYRWYLSIDRQPNAVTEGWPSSSNLINILCESAVEPSLADEPVTIQIRGHSVKQPGVHTPNMSITLNFVETESNIISSWLRGWREAKWSTNTGLQHPKIDLQTEARLVRLNSLDQPIWFYKLWGFYLESYEGQTLDQSTGEFKPSGEFSYDYFMDGPNDTGAGLQLPG